MKLTHVQKQAIIEQGYVHIPGVISQVMVDKALHAINHSIGEGMAKDDIVTMRSRSYCTELQREPVILDLLYKTPAWSLAESAIGEFRLKHIDHDERKWETMTDIWLDWEGLISQLEVVQ